MAELEELENIGLSLGAPQSALVGENGKAREGEVEKRAELGGSEIPSEKSVECSSHGQMG